MIWWLLLFQSSEDAPPVTPTLLPVIRRDGAEFGPLLTTRRSL